MEITNLLKILDICYKKNSRGELEISEQISIERLLEILDKYMDLKNKEAR